MIYRDITIDFANGDSIDIYTCDPVSDIVKKVSNGRCWKSGVAPAVIGAIEFFDDYCIKHRVVNGVVSDGVVNPIRRQS